MTDRIVSSRERIITILTVTLVTVLIWIWAAGETRRTEREFASLSFVPPTEGSLRITPSEVANVEFEIRGPQRAISKATERFRTPIDVPVGAFGLLVFLTQRLLWPFTRVGAILDLYQRAMASTRRVLDMLEVRPAIVDGPKRLSVDEVAGEVRFDHVRFAYDAKVPILQDLELTIRPGETTAIVGSTGSGKSTIIKLLLRFYDLQIDHGRITLDDTEVRELHLRDLRRAISLVSQDVYLFEGSVRENIAYGWPGEDDDPADWTEPPFSRIVEAAKLAEAHEFILELPDGYDTVVGERGQKISGGQRQRIAMARAVLKDAPILVLDEATASVDNETEAAMQRSLRTICRDRTTIVIAHRLSTVRHAACINVLDRGRVAERGTHDELVARNGIYAQLWRVQTGVVEEA